MIVNRTNRAPPEDCCDVLIGESHQRRPQPRMLTMERGLNGAPIWPFDKPPVRLPLDRPALCDSTRKRHALDPARQWVVSHRPRLGSIRHLAAKQVPPVSKVRARFLHLRRDNRR